MRLRRQRPNQSSDDNKTTRRPSDTRRQSDATAKQQPESDRLEITMSAANPIRTVARHKLGPAADAQSSPRCYTCWAPRMARRRQSTPMIQPNRSLAALLLVIVAISCSSTTFLPQAGANAVVRPTIFKSDEAPNQEGRPAAAAPSAAASQVAASGQQATQQQQQQQQQQQLQQSTQVQQHPFQADVPQAAHQQQIVPNNKINPMKSRFCANSNGLRLDAPLGLQSFGVDDLSLSASSFSNERVRPHLARLNLDILGGAWCPMKPISSSNFGKEWIQVKLNRSFVVSAIETQGRFAMGSGKEFVPSYSVEYSRNGGHTWHTWKNFRGSSLLKANDDTNSPVRNELSPPIVGANVIRIVPFSQHLRTVCLRFELHGCHYDEGAPIAYSMMNGVVDSRWGYLIDYTYDGLRPQHGPLAGGLGQLVDGVRGPDNFSHNSGFEWIGWKSMNGDVVIEFTFKTLRNFTGALFHSNNLFSSGVEVFQGVDVHYGIDVPLSFEQLRDSLAEQRRREPGSYVRPEQQPQPPQQTLWSHDMQSIEYEPDKKAESARPVTVHLKQRLANKLKFVLKFASKWILVSEVEFLSHPVELMSLASLSEQLTPQLMGALAPAKTYDEYVAILREHQLRRIVTDAYLEGDSSTSAGITTPVSSTSGDVSDEQQPQDSTSMAPAADEYYGEPGGRPPRIMPGPRTPILPPLPGPDDYPSTNPNFQQPAFIGKPPSEAPSGSNRLDLSVSGEQQQHSRARTVGLATVVAFAFVVILVIVGLLFVVSNYRLRQQPKLNSQRQWCGPAKGFMSNVLASAADRQHYHNQLSLQQQQQQQQQHHIVDPSSISDSHYNPLFANSGHSSDGSLKQNNTSSGPLSTLKRLATLGGGNKPQTNLLFNTTGGHQQHANQLLVSLKDPNSLQNKAGQQQSINTQLIVGLNQANPLAQQQIYNSQQTYATHYSTSMSMASGSSTNGGQQGDYSGPDYAVPDGQPIISQRPLFAANEPHFNQAFGTPQQQLRQKQMINGSSFRTNTGRFAAHQPRGPLIAEHNYELIDGGEQQPFAANQRVMPMIHQRTLSNHNQQLMGYNGQQQQQQQQCQTFNSMTLNSNQLNRARQQQHQLLSPVGSTSGQTTTTTSADSSTSSGGGPAGGADGLASSIYYYSSTEAAKSCQLDK